MITVEVIVENKYVSLNITGAVDSNGAPELEQALSALFSEGKTVFLMDLSKVKYVSSAGLRVFLEYQKKVKSVKGKIVLCGLTEGVQEVFDISGFAAIFQIFSDRESAIAKL